MRIQFEKLTLQDPGKEGQCREYVEESILFNDIVIVFFAVKLSQVSHTDYKISGHWCWYGWARCAQTVRGTQWTAHHLYSCAQCDCQALSCYR